MQVGFEPAGVVERPRLHRECSRRQLVAMVKPYAAVRAEGGEGCGGEDEAAPKILLVSLMNSRLEDDF